MFSNREEAILVHVLKARGAVVSQIGRDGQKPWRPNPWLTKARGDELVAVPITGEEAAAALDTATEGDLALPITDEEAAAAIDAAVAKDDFDATA
jgi:hypothetical protein